MNPTRLWKCFRIALLAAICPQVSGETSSPPAAASDWKQAGWGGGGFYFAAVFHPTRDGVIYMGGDVNGVYRTEDHGRSWRIINNGLASYAVYSLAVSRSEADTVFAATEDGLCKSIDGGARWTTLPRTGPKDLRITGERKLSIRAIAVDPVDGHIVYAASPGGKVYKSNDGGQTWAVSYEKKAQQEEAGVLRIQFGRINGEYYGDFALPVAFPAGSKSTGCEGIGFSMKGDGSTPKDCFLVLKTQSGVIYRSKNLNQIYKETAWRDVVLRAEDFIVDPDYVKKHPDATADSSIKKPDWSDIVRLDLACSGALPNEATVGRFTRFFFAMPAAAGGQSAFLTFRDFKTDPSAQAFGNIRLGPLPPGAIHSVTVSAVNPSRVIASTSDSGLVMSRDAGKTWTPLDTPTKAASATFDPSNPEVIYAAFFEKGVMKSTDSGKTWRGISKGIDAKSELLEIAVSPTEPKDLYAIGAVDWNGACYRSADGGETWTKSDQLKVDTEANPTLDGGESGMAGISAPRNIAINPHNPKEIFIAANWRPCLSSDGGLTWTERDQGTDISCITDIRFDKGRTYVTAMDEGTLVSGPNGGNWRQLWPRKYTAGLSGHNWRVAISGERILSTVSPWEKVPTCVVRSDDGGANFQVIQTGLPDYIVRPNTMWGQGYPRALAVDPDNPQTVYLGLDGDAEDGKSGGGIFRSNDGGTTWAQLPQQPASRRVFFGLAVDPTNSKRLFWGASGAGGGVYRSEDQGNSWQHVFSGENFVWNLLATTDGTIYCSGQQLWRSSDHGTTWKQVSDFTEKRSIVGFEVDPRDPRTIWVSATTWNAIADGGIYKTINGGTSWQNITGNIPYVKPQILRFNPDTNELWAGGVGLYKLPQ